MPIPAAGAAAGATTGQGLATAATVAQGAMGIGSPLMAHFTNVKNRKFAREQYKIQRQDALADWAMQNEYNSPRAQMQRFQEAGLNPHLIYGQQNEGATVRSSSANGGQATAPQFDQSAITSMYNLSRTSAQTDLVAKQMSLMDEDIKLRQYQQAATIAGTGKTGAEIKKLMQDIGITEKLAPFTIAGAAAGVDKTKADTLATIDNNKRQADLHPGNLTAQQVSIKKDLMTIAQTEASTAKSNAEIQEINQKVLLLQKENIIKKLDADLASRGIRPGDDAYKRWMKEAFDTIRGEAGQAVEAIKKGKFVNKQGTFQGKKPYYKSSDSQ